MRPDAYKRERSRRYKKKHGIPLKRIVDPKNPKAPQETPVDEEEEEEDSLSESEILEQQKYSRRQVLDNSFRYEKPAPETKTEGGEEGAKNLENGEENQEEEEEEWDMNELTKLVGDKELKHIYGDKRKLKVTDIVGEDLYLKSVKISLNGNERNVNVPLDLEELGIEKPIEDEVLKGHSGSDLFKSSGGQVEEIDELEDLLDGLRVTGKFVNFRKESTHFPKRSSKRGKEFRTRCKRA